MEVILYDDITEKSIWYTTCPICGEEIYFDKDPTEDSEVICLECNNMFNLEYRDGDY